MLLAGWNGGGRIPLVLLRRLTSSAVSVRCSSCANTNSSDQSNRLDDVEQFLSDSQPEDVREGGRRRRRNIWKLRQYRFTRHVINLIRKGKVEEAREVFSHMLVRMVRPDAAVFNALIAGYGRKGDIKTAFKLFNDMKKRAILPTSHAYTSLFSACAKAGPRSVQYLTKIRDEIERRDVVLNTIASNALISALASCGKHEEAFEVYQDMLKTQLEPQVHTFGSLLGAAAADPVLGLERAQRVWREMTACRIAPDLQCYSLLLHCLRDAGVPQSMRRPMTEGVEHEVAVSVIRKEEGGLECLYKDDVIVRPRVQVPFTVAANRELTLYLGGGRRRWEQGRERKEVRWLGRKDANWLLGEAGRVGVKLFHLLASLVVDPAYLLGEMERRRVKPDGPLMVAAIRTQAHLGNFQGAKSLHSLAESMELELEQTGYQAIASGCIRLSEGNQLLRDIRAAGQVPNEYIYGTLLSNAARSRNYECLTHILKEMKRDEVLPNQFIQDILAGVITHKPKGENQLKRFNGFNGYYQLWKRTMSPV